MQTFFPIFSEKSQKSFIFVNFEAIFCKHKQYAPPKALGRLSQCRCLKIRLSEGYLQLCEDGVFTGHSGMLGVAVSGLNATLLEEPVLESC